MSTSAVGRSPWITPAADADVSVGATATFTIPDGTMISLRVRQERFTPSTILVVTEKGRNNFTGADAIGSGIEPLRRTTKLN